MEPYKTDKFKEIEPHIKAIMEIVGEDTTREGLVDTPKRFARSWERLFSGYQQDPREILKASFTEENVDQMVMLRDIELYSTCEHHLLPFTGRVHIAYIPKKTEGGKVKVVGISKLARLVECFGRRMQIQERLTSQIANALKVALDPIGVAVVVEAQHLCMTSRGVEKQNSVMVTSAMLDYFRDNIPARQEFLDLTLRRK